MSALDLLKATGGPGSLGLLGLLVLAGLVLTFVWPRRATISRVWFIVVAASYLVLALPVVAWSIDGLIPPAETVPAGQVGSGFDTLVIFDGDNRRGRLAAAMTIWAAVMPRRIVVSGGDWLVDELLAAGVPRDRVDRESDASTTREQVSWLIGDGNNVASDSMAVIVSRLQGPRVTGLLRQARQTTKVVAAPLDAEPAKAGVWRYIPSYSALRLSRDAIYEVLALKYYRRRGWLE